MLTLIGTSGSKEKNAINITVLDNNGSRLTVTVPKELSDLSQDVADAANMLHNTGPIYWRALTYFTNAYLNGMRSILKKD